jgi:hypothetical protein
MDGWSDGNAPHELRLCYPGPAPRNDWAAICRCGWSTPLCASEGRARELMREHVRGHALGAADHASSALYHGDDS